MQEKPYEVVFNNKTTIKETLWQCGRKLIEDVILWTTKSSRAGLTFPVGRLTRYLRQGNYSKRCSPGAGIFMAAVLEYLFVSGLRFLKFLPSDTRAWKLGPRSLFQKLDLGRNSLQKKCFWTFAKKKEEVFETIRLINFSFSSSFDGRAWEN